MRQPVPSETPAQALTEGRITLARVVRAHGVRGAVRCRLFAESADSLASARTVFLSDGRTTRVQVLSAGRGHALCRLTGVTDRESADALVGTELAVARSTLPAPDADSYYHADLIGLTVRDAAANHRGVVIAVHNFGAGDLLEVQPPAGESVHVPFTADAVPEIDVASGILRTDAVWFEAPVSPGPATAADSTDDDQA